VASAQQEEEDSSRFTRRLPACHSRSSWRSLALAATARLDVPLCSSVRDGAPAGQEGGELTVVVVAVG